jgi:hypothetical protein
LFAKSSWLLSVSAAALYIACWPVRADRPMPLPLSGNHWSAVEVLFHDASQKVVAAELMETACISVMAVFAPAEER